MEYLGAHGYANVIPSASRNGKLVETVMRDEGAYYGVVFTEASGGSLDLEMMTDGQFEQWGQSLANLHLLSRSYLPAGEQRPGWDEVLASVGQVLKRYPLEFEAIAELDRVSG